MRVIKRTGEYEEVSFDKVLNRLKTLSTELNVDVFDITQKVCARIFDLVKTSELDELAAQICSSMIIEHPDYNKLASRIIVSNHHKNTSPSFSENITALFEDNQISEELYDLTVNHKEKINSYIDYTRDYDFDYFGFKTLERAYLLKVNGKILERPQQMFMRVALGIHGKDFKDALTTYDLMSKKYYIHATPTLFNAGTIRPQLSSCFVKDTRVYTTTGVKAIQNVKIGDNVITHLGRAKPVVQLHTNPLNGRTLYDFNVIDMPTITATDNHEFMKLIDQIPTWTPLEDIQIGDYIQIGNYITISDFVIIDNIKYGKIASKSLSNSTETVVYTLGVEDDHSYIVQNVIAKNCFLISLKDDSIEGIFDTLKETAQISKFAGGIGLHVSNVRSKGSKIRSTNGKSDGLLPMLKVFNHTANYVNQCFTPDTEIITKTGIKAISDIQYLDEVLSMNINTKIGEYSYVLEVFQREVHDEDLICIFTGDEDGPILKCTHIHEIAILENSEIVFRSADELRVGDNLIMPGEVGYPAYKLNKISLIQVQIYTGLVYDLNIQNNHNYVTTSGLVHNSGKRNGSVAVYLEPWHADIESFLEMKKNHGNEEERARDLFYALWIPDLFMRRVQQNAQWSLMCPDKCPGLSEVYGEEFDALYKHYENQKSYTKQVNAQELWFKFLETQIETGNPFLLYKDAANFKSNQKNLGTIKSSNLCVAPETRILTNEGYFRIADLEDEIVSVWNGTEFTSTIVMRTGINQKLLTVTFDNGIKLRCTPYHKFHIIDDTGAETKYEAWQLTPGMNIINYTLPIIDYSKDELSFAYIKGFTEAEFVPLNYALESRIQWLSGYIDRDGQIIGQIIQLDIKNPTFRTELFLMLQTIGIYVKIQNTCIILLTEHLIMLTKYGLKLQKLDISTFINSNNISKLEEEPTIILSIKIVSVEDNDERSDTFCFNEPKEHKGIFNGILTGNCTEVIQYSSADETSVCNLASICLPTYIQNGIFDYDKLHEVTRFITKSLNKVIDRTFYPVETAKNSNLKHRPLGIGFQGLADALVMMRIPFDSPEAVDFNKKFAETVYHAALTESMSISKKRALDPEYMLLNQNEYEKDLKYPGSYSSFEGSPASAGLLQFDLWNVVVSDTRYNWTELKSEIMQWGLRNSLLMAPMPTASTSQICSFNECIEPFTSNLYKRKVLAGEYILVNKYLVSDLIGLNLWTKDIQTKLLQNEGSIQNIPDIPDEIKNLYKTTWELKQKVLIDLAAARAPFVCQSQSLNLFLEDPDFKKLSSMHFYVWNSGLKSSYYLRSKPRAKVQQFTIEPPASSSQNQKKTKAPPKECIPTEDGVCLMCSA